MPRTSARTAKGTVARLTLAVYSLLMALILFWPTPVDAGFYGPMTSILQFLHNHGVPTWFNYHFVEAAANVTMFFPFGLLLCACLGRWRWLTTVGIALGFSVAVELVQLTFLTHRFAALADVLSNTTGAAIGAAATLIFWPRRKGISV